MHEGKGTTSSNSSTRRILQYSLPFLPALGKAGDCETPPPRDQLSLTIHLRRNLRYTGKISERATEVVHAAVTSPPWIPESSLNYSPLRSTHWRLSSVARRCIGFSSRCSVSFSAGTSARSPSPTFFCS